MNLSHSLKSLFCLFSIKVVIPGYCVAGTVGHKVLSGQKKIELDKKSVVRENNITCYQQSANAQCFAYLCRCSLRIISMHFVVSIV